MSGQGLSAYDAVSFVHRRTQAGKHMNSLSKFVGPWTVVLQVTNVLVQAA